LANALSASVAAVIAQATDGRAGRSEGNAVSPWTASANNHEAMSNGQ
jgi:hypothetical protein